MPGKFLNEITADKPAKDDLGLFFDKSKNTTAQSSLVDIVAAGLDITSGKAGEAPVVIEVTNPDGTKTQSLGWGKTGSSAGSAPPRPANATDLIITHDPASGTDGAATPAQVLTAGLPAGGNAGDALTLTASGLAWGSSLPASTTGDKGKQLTVQADGKVAWSSDSSDLPAYTVADKGKQLTVKADGTAVEWVKDTAELPAYLSTDAHKPLTINAAGDAVEWGTKARLLEIDAPPVTGAIGNSVTIAAGDGEGGNFTGGDVVVRLGAPSGTETKRSSLMVHQYDGKHDDRVSPKRPAITAVGGKRVGEPAVDYGLQIWGWNQNFGGGYGQGILFGPSSWYPGVIERVGRTSRIYAEFDNQSTQGSRLIFQVPSQASGYTNWVPGMVLWANGSITVGTANVGAYAPPHEADSIHAKGPVKSDAGFSPPSLADTAASNNRIYFSTTANKLVYKDSAGAVHPLYA